MYDPLLQFMSRSYGYPGGGGYAAVVNEVCGQCPTARLLRLLGVSRAGTDGLQRRTSSTSASTAWRVSCWH
jgi:hypothetical protein